MSRMLRTMVGVVSLALVLGLIGTSTARAGDPSLVGWWTLDEGTGTTAHDSSGNKNDGTLHGTQWMAGKIGGALRFNGTADYVEVPDSPSLQVANTITIAAWVFRQVNSGTWERVVAKSDASNYDYWLQITASNYGSSLGAGFVDSTGAAHANIDTTTGATIPLSQWTHLAFVYDGAYLRGYVNGQSAKSMNIGSFKIRTTAGRPLWLGRLQTAYSFQGLIDDAGVYNRALTQAEIQEIMNGIGGRSSASEPSPADQATDVPRDATLSWKAGQYPALHDVYLGTALADVNTATGTDPKGVLASPGQTDTTFDPPGSLAYGQTYYWRIDEVNKSADGTTYKGKVWSFTAEPYGYPIAKVTATASSFQPGTGPENTINGSGLTGDLHGTESPTMWLSQGTTPNWIQYEFDKVYKLNDLKVWNSNQLIEVYLGFGAKEVKIEYSTDGTTWTELKDVPQFARATGLPDYAANTTVSFGGVMAKYVKLTINSNWGGMSGVTGLSEVRFSYVPVQAHSPQPANAATGVNISTSLSWRPGREAGSHKVFFGTDPNAVANGTAPAQTVTEHSFTPGTLNYGATYYWRVDEVNAVTYPGDLWSFRTQEFAVVDDFESYNDKDNFIFDTWIDGLTDSKSGSQVGYNNAPFAERTLIHGGTQSMPLQYDNSGQFSSSEATRTFAPAQDWTASGIKSLALYFEGAPASPGGQLYLRINGNKVSYNGEAGDLGKGTWMPWNVDLSTVGGNLSKVTSLTIGVEGSGSKGILYVDDIRLYPRVPDYFTPVQPQAAGLAGYYSFDEGSGTTARDSSGNKNDGTLHGAQWTTGKTGGALHFGGTADYVEVADAPTLQAANAITVAAWVLREANKANWERIIARSDATNYDYWLQITSAGAIGGGFTDAAGAAHSIDTVAGAVLPVNQWVHLVFVYDGTYLRGYVNGRLDKSVNIGSFEIRTTAGRPLWFGRLANSYIFQGKIDEGCVYRRALSQEEILWLAGQKTPVAKPF